MLVLILVVVMTMTVVRTKDDDSVSNANAVDGSGCDELYCYNAVVAVVTTGDNYGVVMLMCFPASAAADLRRWP